jgi:hypothetical protein
LPVFKIGFKPLKDNLPLWIAKEKEKGHV